MNTNRRTKLSIAVMVPLVVTVSLAQPPDHGSTPAIADTFHLAAAKQKSPNGKIAKGIQSASISSLSPTDFASADMRASLRDLKRVEASHVTLTFGQQVATTNSCEFFDTVDTPTDAALASATKYARKIGLQVIYQLMVDVKDKTWRALIDPKGPVRSCWWKQFTAFQKHYARIAQANGASIIMMGTELVSMSGQRYNKSNGRHWRSTIAAVRKVYKGKLGYTGQRAGKYSDILSLGFAKKLQVLGLSGYYSMSVSGTPTVAKYKAKWGQTGRREANAMHRKYHKPIFLGEVGYRSVSGARNAPYDYATGGSVNLQEQKQLYQALFSYWNKVPYYAGVNLWQWDSNPRSGGRSDRSFTPQGKPALKVLAHWFGGKASVAPAPSNPTPNPPPATAKTVNIWYPTEGATLSGCQPFKGNLSDTALADYQMRWRVNGDQWRDMYDSTTDYPHKEYSADLYDQYRKEEGVPLALDFQTTETSGKTYPIERRTVYTQPGPAC